MPEARPGRRVAVVAGLRSPFVKSGTVFRDVPAVALARHTVRELLVRSELDGREVDEVIFGQVVPSSAGAQRGTRGEPAAAVPAQRPRLHPEPCLRLGGAGRGQRRRPDRTGSRRRDRRRRSRVPLRHPDPPFPPVQPDPGGGEQGAGASGAAPAAFGRVRPRDLVPLTPAIAEPSTGESHGTVGGEDGEGERHLARGPGPARAPEPSARRRGHRRRPAHGRDRALVRWRGDGSARRHRQRYPVRHLARGAGRSSARSSTASTGR